MERDQEYVNGNNNGSVQEDSATQNSSPVEQELDQEQMKAMLQRAHAELINYKRRAEEEKEEMLKYASSRVVLKILPVLDEFALAIAHAESTAGQQAAGDGNDPQASWLEGVRLIHRKLNTVLESELVDRIEAEGKPFDPLEHEAMGYQESGEHPEGHIMSVVRDGYRMHGRVIRPALVVLAKAPEGRSQQTEHESGTTDSDGKENGNA